MADLWFPEPPTFELPLSLGQDLWVDIVYKPLVVDLHGLPVLDSGGQQQFAITNYPVGATVDLTIDAPTTVTPDEGSGVTVTATQIIAEATITDSHAVILIPSEIVDTVPKKMLWRAVIHYSDGVDVCLVNGTTVRADGK